ncbi:indole-3-glycerol phosphate synthase TrpC [Marinilabiliaceae bacterium ANBcel2]|nr:indole-3-glycerol phosphate synthase TrpC [Marinilabiliaceae bacterium ANBcel2]
MNILDKIITNKREEVQRRQRIKSVESFKDSFLFHEKRPSLYDYLLNGNGIIAEFKRKSPSKGEINCKVTPAQVVLGYQKANVSAISVLTDHKYFGGSNSDLIEAVEVTSLPVIRKEFIIDEYQIYEAKAIGASAILLIGALLTKEQVACFSSLSRQLGMDVLFEIHDSKELDKLNNDIDIVGINNRNLKTFNVDIEQSISLASMLPADKLPVAESGIQTVEDYLYLKKCGFKGFLIGETFMRSAQPDKMCQYFCNQIKIAERC